MTTRLIDSQWQQEIRSAAQQANGLLQLVCPFIKYETLKWLLEMVGERTKVRVITRFNLADFADGVSDLLALSHLLERGGEVRGVKDLHTKLYLFGSDLAIVTSANLSTAALCRNHELGFISDDRETVDRCRDYFDSLWDRSGANLTKRQITAWQKTVDQYADQEQKLRHRRGLTDKGTVVKPPEPGGPAFHGSIDDSGPVQAFVKLFGTSDKRMSLDDVIKERVRKSGCDKALYYSRRPRSVGDGAIMFMGQLVEGNDIRVFGRAVGSKHDKERDVIASQDSSGGREQAWRQKWPYYVSVSQAEFIDGTMGDGISLNALMDELGWRCFASTKRNHDNSSGNTEPRRAYQQKPSVELSEEGLKWLSRRFDDALARGKRSTSRKR